MTKHYHAQPQCQAPAHVLFPQMVVIINRYVKDHVEVREPADIKDIGLSPYYGWLVEILIENIHPDTSGGETPEIPRYESSRGPGSTAEVDYWTSREPREVLRSHLNYIVPDTAKWEQAARLLYRSHKLVDAFVKKRRTGFCYSVFVQRADARLYARFYHSTKGQFLQFTLFLKPKAMIRVKKRSEQPQSVGLQPLMQTEAMAGGPIR